MHIPDGFLDGKTIATTYASAGAVSAYVIKKAKEKIGEEKIPLLGVTAAFIFAAQMVNFPVFSGTSGHLIGGLLAALLAGPWGGFLIMSSVLIVQSLIFADGGLTALGANIFNMAFLGSVVGWYLYKWLISFIKNRRTAVIISSFLSVELAAFACSLELAFSNTAPLSLILPAMLGVHAIIGTGEAVITIGVIEAVRKVRPDLIFKPEGSGSI